MKKVLSILLAVMLIVGIAPTVFAAAPDNDYVLDMAGAYWEKGEDTGDNEIRPEGEYRIPIKILVSGGTNTNATKKDIKDDKVDVKLVATEGKNVYRDISIQHSSNNTVSYVRVRMIENFVSTKDQDFNYEVQLRKDKDNHGDAEVVSGTFANASQKVSENDDYVYLGNKPVVEADDYVKSIEVELENGVSIFTKMFEGKKYYGKVTQDVKAEDDEIVSQYPAIDTIYYLSTIGLNSAGNTVKIDVDDKYYVYNANMEYIGTTSEKLPYSTKYYLATEELEIEEEEEIEEPTGEDDNNDAPSATGGDDVETPNTNNNPSTGR